MEHGSTATEVEKVPRSLRKTSLFAAKQSSAACFSTPRPMTRLVVLELLNSARLNYVLRELSSIPSISRKDAVVLADFNKI